jgi:uncharacterized protein (DUF1330 family)
MKAYIIVDVTVKDPVQYEAYKKMTPSSLVPFQGKFVVRGGQSHTLEGTWQPGRVVVLEFPSTDLAHAWWSSSEYEPAKKIRQSSSVTQMLLIEGFE